MQKTKGLESVLAILVLGGALVSAGEVMVPEVTEMPDAPKVLLSLNGGGEDPFWFAIRSIGGDEQRATRALPREGIDRYKLALIAQTAKDGGIAGHSLVTWTPAEKKAEREWPVLTAIDKATATIRGGAQALLLRPLPADQKKWGFEVISFRRIEPKEDEEAILKAKKEVIEEGGARFVEEGRFPLIAPAPPTAKMRYGVLLLPVWKEPGRILDGFDAQLVTTPAPTGTAGE
jgi:hypothetical protein